MRERVVPVPAAVNQMKNSSRAPVDRSCPAVRLCDRAAAGTPVSTLVSWPSSSRNSWDRDLLTGGRRRSEEQQERQVSTPAAPPWNLSGRRPPSSVRTANRQTHSELAACSLKGHSGFQTLVYGWQGGGRKLTPPNEDQRIAKLLDGLLAKKKMTKRACKLVQRSS